MKRQKDEIKIPKATQLKSGKWNIYLRAEGQSVTEDTEELCNAKARAIRAGFIETQKTTMPINLKDAISGYIEANSSVLSPATLRGYDIVKRYRFQKYQNCQLSSINWQAAINEESKIHSPKTVRNAWGLVTRVMRVNHIAVPEVRLPQVPTHELPWLNFQQIETFLAAIRGQQCEIAALLALHSLRRSELMIISPTKIIDRNIIVKGAEIVGIGNARTVKESNKNKSSQRVVPIVIPRLEELVSESDNAPNEPYVTMHINAIQKQINRLCRQYQLPEVGVHGLRRSFASLAYHLGWQERKTMAIGGWSDFQTMHNIYIKLDNADLTEAAETMRKFYSHT